VDCGLIRTRLLSAIRDNPQWGISQSNIDLQMTAISEEEERNRTEISKLESLKSNANQSNELRQRLEWVKQEFNTGTIYDFTKVSDEHKKKILNQLIDKVEINGNNEVTVRLALPKPELADSFVLMSTLDKSVAERI
jgi:hypothetical protein